MKIWNVQYKGHEIRVESHWFSGERLVVDGELEDEQLGCGFRSWLSGSIPSGGDGAEESIKVSLGGFFTVGCRVFVDHKLVLMS